MSVVYQFYPLISGKNRNSGSIVPRPQILKDCEGEPFILENEQLKFYASGEVYVPAKIMKKYGHLRKDGRYVIAIMPVLLPLNGKLVRGAVIPHVPGIEDVLETVDFNQIITWEDGIITADWPLDDCPKSFWYGQDHFLGADV